MSSRQKFSGCNEFSLHVFIASKKIPLNFSNTQTTLIQQIAIYFGSSRSFVRLLTSISISSDVCAHYYTYCAICTEIGNNISSWQHDDFFHMVLSVKLAKTTNKMMTFNQKAEDSECTKLLVLSKIKKHVSSRWERGYQQLPDDCGRMNECIFALFRFFAWLRHHIKA